MKSLAFFLVALLAALLAQWVPFVPFVPSAAASCPKPAFTDPSRIAITADAVMIVTHASSRYDARLASKHGVEQAIRLAKSRYVPLVYLADGNAASAEHYFTDDCAPDHWVFSEEGEIKFDVRASHLYLVGGHLEVCLTNTLQDVLHGWSKQPQRDRTVTYFMDGIYSNGKDIEQSDPYYREYAGFMSVVTYGRPGAESWPKLTLLETMGIIRVERRQYDYLERILPVYQRSFGSDYRVEVRVNDGPVKVMQPGRGARPPLLRFNFVDTAVTPAPTTPATVSAD